MELWIEGKPVKINSVIQAIKHGIGYATEDRKRDGLALGLDVKYNTNMVYALILGIVLAKSRIGRQIYACGSNLEAAKLSGINAVKTRMFAYCISGLSAAICGILVASRLSSTQPTAGTGNR